LVSPLILKGQPLTHIWSEHGEELGISQRTLYRYIDQGVLSVGNIDLRRKAAYKPRKKKKEVSEGFLNQEFRKVFPIILTDKSTLRLMELMGLHTVPADEVNLTPALLKSNLKQLQMGTATYLFNKAGCVHFDKTRFQSVCFAMPKRQ